MIEIPDFKPDHQVKGTFRQADAFLLPSITGGDGDMEGIPVVLIEAMVVGILMTLIIHSGIPEPAEPGKSNWLASESDA